MVAIKDITDLINIFSKIENPVVISVLVVFIGFFLIRKFTNSEYITVGKETITSLKSLYDTLYKAHDDLKKEYSELKDKFENLQTEIEKCRDIINELTQVIDKNKLKYGNSENNKEESRTE